MKPRSMPARIFLAAPLVAALLWLPLRSGGAEPLHLSAIQALTFAVTAWAGITGRIRLPRGTLGVLVAALAFVSLATGVATAFTRDLDASIPHFIAWLWLLSMAALYSAGNPAARYKLVVAALIASVLMQSLWSHFVWWGGGSPAAFQSGTFYAPNAFAGFLVLLAPLVLSPALLSPSRTTAAGWGALAILVYLGIALSGSRGGIAAAVVGLVAALLLSALRRPPTGVAMRTAALAVGFVAAAAFATSSLVLSVERPAQSGAFASVENKPESTASSLGIRMTWARGAFRIMSSRPLTGTGPGTYGSALLGVMDPGWHWSLYAHNHYLEALAEGGFLLGAGVAAFTIAAFAGAARNLRGREGNLYRPAVLAALAGGSAHLLVDFDWSYPGFAVSYLAVALLASTPGDVAEPDSPSSLGPPAGILALVLFAVVAARLGASVAPSTLDGRDRAVRLTPYATTPRTQLASSLASAGLSGRAHRLLAQTARIDTLDAQVLWALAETSEAAGDEKAARRAYSWAIEAAPNSPVSYARAARFRRRTGDSRAAAEILDRGLTRLKLRPQRARLLGSIVSLLYDRHDLALEIDGARPALEFGKQAVELAPLSPPAWLLYASALCLDGRQQDGRRAREHAQSLSRSPLPPAIPIACA